MTLDSDADGAQDVAASSRLLSVALWLRLAAIVLLLVGSVGVIAEYGAHAPTESPFAILFVLGVLAAILSIALAIYQHEIDEGDQ